MGELQHTQRLAAAHVIAHWIEISPSCASRPLTMACHAMGTSHHQPILAAARAGYRCSGRHELGHEQPTSDSVAMRARTRTLLLAAIAAGASATDLGVHPAGSVIRHLLLAPRARAEARAAVRTFGRMLEASRGS